MAPSLATMLLKMTKPLRSGSQGKVFPKLRKRLPQGSGSADSVSDKEEDEATDYVFRILFPNSLSEFGEVPSTNANKSRLGGIVLSSHFSTQYLH